MLLMLLCLSLAAGKTQLVRGKLAGLPEDMMSLGINFNYFTDVISFQKVLESPLEKKAGINYGPPGECSRRMRLTVLLHQQAPRVRHCSQ
jgi:hypothetical protein